MRGGQGYDILAISDFDFNRLVGGTGEDTVCLDGLAMMFDLAAIPDTRMVDIEVIDLNSYNNAVDLDPVELANISTHSNTLTVTGDAINAVVADLSGHGFTASSKQPALFPVWTSAMTAASFCSTTTSINCGS